MKTPHQSVIALAIGFFMTVATAVRGADPQSPEGREFLGTLAAQIAAFEKGSIRADVEMSFFRSLEKATPMRGEFEFDASGEKWRKRSVVEPGRAMSMDTEIAYDGETFQYADHAAGLLSISAGTDRRTMGMTLPNPLVLMGQWLVPRHDEDPKDVTLGMLRDAAREFDPEAVRWEQTDGGVVGVLPGADSSFGEFDVRIAPPRDGAPAGIEFVVRDSGAIFMRTTLDDWRDVGAERWPHAIEADVFDPASNQPVGVMTLTITSLTREDPGDVFTLDRHAFERVWSDDAATFVKGGAAICEKPAALVSDLVRRWRAAPEDVDFLATLAGIDHQTAPDEAFQLFQLSEREYAEKVTGMSRAEREKFDTELFHEEVRDKRRVIRTVIDSAIERANAGEADLAEQALAALDRIADVSSRPEQLAIGRLVAEKLKQQIAEARAKVEKPEPAWEAHPTAEPSAAANAYEHVRDIYARWTESTKPMDLVEAFSELEKRAEGEASFRLYSLTEAEHLALSESERTENLRRYMVEGATYRAIFRQAVDEATERIRAGDDEAESALVAMERVVEASKEQGQLEFGRLLARLFESWVDEARKQIDDR